MGGREVQRWGWCARGLVRAACLAAVALVGVSAGAVVPPPADAATPCGPSKTIPRYTHIVVIAFENTSYQSVL
ncbi:MAG TPA: hypothetical protein VGL44_01610, partial [Gaiellales bacterium]